MKSTTSKKLISVIPERIKESLMKKRGTILIHVALLESLDRWDNHLLIRVRCANWTQFVGMMAKSKFIVGTIQDAVDEPCDILIPLHGVASIEPSDD